MRLKENTEKTSGQLRLIAGFVLALGIVIAILLIVAGIVVATSSSYYSYYRNDFMYLLHRMGMVSCIIIAVIVFFWHYVTFVMISAQATLVENSDRSDVVDALMQINATLQHGDPAPSEKVVKKAVDAVVKKQPSALELDSVKPDKFDAADES